MDSGKTGTGLHARKSRPAHHDLDYLSTQDTHDSGRRRPNKKRSMCFPAFLRSDVGYAIESVSFFLICGFALGYFVLHHQHHKVLHILSDPLGHMKVEGRVGFRHHFYTGHPRTVTVVLPSVVNPKKRKRRLNSIFETWGPNARAIYVAHNVSEFPQAGSHAVLSDNSKPEDPYSYPQILLVPPEIGFDDGLPRLNYVIRSVYEKINPDFAFFVNDHTFVIPEHLCKYLEDKRPSDHMYHGHAMKNDKDVFNSGAAGYILSRKTMKSLVDKWDAEDPICLVKNGEKWLQGNPGLVTTKCLKEVIGVEAVDTRLHGKYHRFHAFPLTRVVSGTEDDWYKKKHEGMDQLMKTDKSYNQLVSGMGCCAEDTISFHYVEHIESRALFATRKSLLTNARMTDQELKSLMIAEWPRKREQIGFYSLGLPKAEDNDAWEPLLEVTRRISQRNNQREC
eukprot:scaffold26676_cov137-Cylindrotheca_fusiformis.AAC.8